MGIRTDTRAGARGRARPWSARARASLEVRGAGRARVGTGLALAAVTAAAALVPTASDDVPSAAAQSPGSGGPNFVVIQTDDMVVGDLRAMPRTERLLGRRGTRFSRHFATHPRCCPSRASYLTGQYTHNHGVIANNEADGGGYGSLDHSETLPVWLDRAGYETGHIGKYMNGYGGRGREREIPPGWDQWFATAAGTATEMYGYNLNENGRPVEYGGKRRDYQANVFSDKAVRFIRSSGGGAAPFYLSLNPSAPHVETKRFAGPEIPRNPRPAPGDLGRYEDVRMPKPPSFDEKNVRDKPRFVRERSRFDRKKTKRIEHRYISRLESLIAVDEMVARVVRTLGSTGTLGDTVIVFMSDNGYFQGEHRLPGKKAELYEAATHVPLLIRGPGFPAGATRRQLTGNIDIAPTLVDLAGAETAGHPIDGISLAPLAADPSRERGRDLLFDNGVGGSTAVRTSRYSYIEHRTDETELYDLRKDPHELKSLHGTRRYRDTRNELAEYLAQLRECAGASCRAGPPR
jgi:arylsulfatase A-like enzyme